MANLKDIIVNGTSRFIGKVFGPTPSEGDYSKQLATTEYVIDNSANQSISNLTEEGESKINASKCLLTNTIVTDPTAYNAVKSYSQDSFDLSKFEVVGSPTITDDGVASGFSVGNYLTTSIIPFSTAQNYKICGIFTTPSEIPAANSIIYSNTVTHYLYIHAGKDFVDYISPSGGRLSIPYSVNTIYYYEIGYNGSKVFFNLTNLKTGVTESRIGGNASNKLTIDSASYLGIFSNNTYGWQGSIDLKHFSITVDGVEVFSGNKTGIDAIKPLDAEELGDIYVNEHGIAENFNVNNAIKAPISFNPVSTVKIRSLLTWNTGSAQPKDGINVPYVFGPNKWRLEVTSTNIHATNDLDTSTNTAFNITIPELQNGNVIEIIETIAIGTRTVKVIINETDEYSGSTTFAANQAFSTSELAIGNAAFDGSSEYFWNGAINLNMFIVYIDGKLTYEPCLYIPYTQSKTGSKIVENVYRNRVYELYNQTGKAEYYTLDIENENITLPLGEIYGLITSKADTVNVANKSLEDLTDDGNALINNSKAWITGKLTDDKTTYDAIKKLSVSTFDRSKFEVVGSPIISEDGIASGFSTDKYLYTPIALTNDFKVIGSFLGKTTTEGTNECFFNFCDLLGTEIYSLNLAIQHSTGGIILSKTVNGTVTTIFYASTKNYRDNFEHIFDVSYKNNILTVKIDGISIYSQSHDLADIITNTQYCKIGAWIKAGFYLHSCSIDLKQFSIIVDGVEVFSGNRTELDVIKADNFEVVNTGRTIYAYVYNDGSVNHTIYANSATAPTTLYNEDGTAYTGTDFTVADNVVSYSGNTCTYTSASNITLYINITEDGIASGFSTSNYIKTIQLSELANKSWDIEGKFEHVPTNVANMPLLGLTPTYAVRGALFYLSGTVSFGAYIGATGDTTSEGVKIRLSNVLTTTGTYYYKLSFNLLTGKYTLSIYDSNKVLINSGEYIPPTTNKQLWDINNNPTTYISVSKTLSGLIDFTGSIDLNAFKIYVDGNLVYQPCLKIPYTLSKTGSKIVDAAYYDRVIDVYEQYGSAYYYTLDRQNGLSSLPFGDIYGLMMKKDDSPDYFSADTPIEFPFIAWREGYINVTVPANEKLLINDNEVVSAGTSAVQMQLRVGLYDNITFSNTTGAALTFYPCKGVLYTI